MDFDLYEGEIHALVGEHRAGKSSLVKILSGAIQKSKGTIILRGKEISSFTPKSALKNKIAMVYQDLNIIPSLNVMENLFAGRMISNKIGGLNYTEMYRQSRVCANKT